MLRPSLSALALGALLAAASGCATTPATPASQDVKPVRVASTGLAYGDCAEARIRAAAKPDLDVDRVPAPVAMKPRPFVGYPRSALRKDGSAVIRVDVVVDTLGRADMRTFRVVEVSHPWFTRNIRKVIAKWRFTPAQVAGCKVPRVYHFMASLNPRHSAAGGR